MQNRAKEIQMLDGTVTSCPADYRCGGFTDRPNLVGVGVYRCGNYCHIPVESPRVFCQIVISHHDMGCQPAYRSCFTGRFKQAEPTVCGAPIANKNGVIEIKYQWHLQKVHDLLEYRRTEQCGLSKHVH